MNIIILKKHLIQLFTIAFLISIASVFIYAMDINTVEMKNSEQNEEILIDKLKLALLNYDKRDDFGSYIDKYYKNLKYSDNYHIILEKNGITLYNNVNKSTNLINCKKIELDGYTIQILHGKHPKIYRKIDIFIFLSIVSLIYIILFISLMKSLKQLKLINKMSGLYNSEKLIDIVKNTKSKFAILTIDVRKFSNINHGYGLIVGDKIIIKIGNFLNSILEYNMQLFHITGDRFIIFEENYTKKSLESIVNTIKEYSKNNTFDTDNLSFKLEFNIGIVKNEKNQFIEKSYVALTEAKKENKDVVYYSNLVSKEKEYILSLKSSQKISNALDNQLFEPFFQAIINNKTGKIEKFEALARLYDKETGKYLSPASFLGEIKENGKIRILTKIMIDKVFSRLQDKNFIVSINLSEEDFIDDNLLVYLEEKFKEYNIKPSNIIFEIVESTTRSDRVIKIVKELKKMGCLIAIDDFGSEHSNFLRILDMNVDFIKIDGEFIKSINNSYKSFKIVETIVNFANSINTSVVAEYVSNKAIQKIILDLKIDYSQGYLISKPTKELEA